jgi:hypothetical protein
VVYAAAGFAEYVRQLYTTHQRKRAFVAALDAGWPPS